MSKTKLSTTQRDVLAKMRDGWVLRFWEGPSPRSSITGRNEWLPAHPVRIQTCRALHQRGWVAYGRPEWEGDGRLVLTDADREAIDV